MKNYFKKLLFLLFALYVNLSFCTEDSFNYTPLNAKGAIPSDFSTYTIEKILEGQHNHGEEFEKLPKREQKFFLKAVHQGIDEILRSGKVLYGDPVTDYINDLGHKIIGDDPDLQDLRFYTLKTNVVNAFSTNQGIIFVSQGLIAQVKNEAELAFVLAHEIGHYIEKHVIIGFKERMDLLKKSGNISEKIKRLSIYSKDKEYEADRVGIRLYNEAGYNLQDLFGVFDLLTFAYLPFDLKEVKTDFFNSDKMFLPTSFFKNDLPKVEPEDDYDDSKSSHPNIKSRKEQLDGEVKKYKTWDEITRLSPENAFEQARVSARMEQIRNNLYEFDYISAIYNLFLLEDHADNIHYQRYLAQAWYGLMMFKSSGKFTNIVISMNRIQGEQHQMHHVIRSLNKRQLATVALRNIYDVYQNNKNDEIIEKVYHLAVKNFASDKKLKLKKFHKISYYEAIGDSTVLAAELDEVESVQLMRQRQELGLNSDGKISDDDFYLFAIPDIIQDDDFNRLYNKFSKAAKDKDEEEEAFDGLDRKTRFKINQEKRKKQLQVEVKNVILLEPRAFTYQRYEYDILRAEQLELKLKAAFEKVNVDFMTVHKIGSKEFKEADEEIYNEKAVLMNVLMQLSEYEELDVFPVDYELIQSMRKKYKTDKVAFMVLENVKRPIRGITSLLTAFVPMWSIKQKSKQFSTELPVILFDLKEYRVDGFSYNEVVGNPSAITLEAMVYDVLKTFSMPKTNK